MPECIYNPASDNYYDFILRYLYGTPESAYEYTNAQCISFINREYVIVHALRKNIKDLNIADYSYAAIPKIYGLLDVTALESAGILPVFDQPALKADGRGVIIGFLDTGLNYTSPLFRNKDGSTRVLSIWDQTIGNDVVPPVPQSGYYRFSYGTIYTKEEIDAALATDDPLSLVPTRDENGHGTAMASIAAGNDLQGSSSFLGAAPAAFLAVVKLKQAKQYLRDFFLIPEDVPAFQENDIMAGISFLLHLASQYRLPLVLYLGVGTNQGSHDGTSPVGKQLQNLSGSAGIAAITGAGNETGYQHHYFGIIPQDQSYEDVELRVAPNERGFCMELWAREPDLFTIGFVSPSGEVIDRIPLVLGRNTSIPFRLDASTVTVNYVNYEANSGSQLIFLRFRTPSAGIWHIRVYPSIRATGQFHIWLPMHQFISDDTVFLKPDPDTTITDPGNAQMPTTAGAYDHRSGGIYIHSSHGFSRSGLIKPEITAPGVNVQGLTASIPAGDSSLSQAPRFTTLSGTSVSAAITAGAVADIFTWGITDENDLTLSGAAAQSMLIRGATRNPAYIYPSKEWGYGMLNLYQAFLNGRE